MPLDSSGLATGPGGCSKAMDADLQEGSDSLLHSHKITSGKSFGISGFIYQETLTLPLLVLLT